MCSSKIANASPLLGKQPRRVKSLTKRNVNESLVKTSSSETKTKNFHSDKKNLTNKQKTTKNLDKLKWLYNVTWHGPIMNMPCCTFNHETKNECLTAHFASQVWVLSDQKKNGICAHQEHVNRGKSGSSQSVRETDFLSYRTEFLFPGQPQQRLPGHSGSQDRRVAKPIWIYQPSQPLPERGRALLLNWSSDMHLQTRVHHGRKQCRSSHPDPQLALQLNTQGPSSKSDIDWDARNFFQPCELCTSTLASTQ